MLEKVVRIAVNLTPNENQLEQFVALAKEMSATSNAEPGTVGYEWFSSADGKRFRLLETYADAAAVEAHFTGPTVTQLVPKLVALCSIDAFEIYGDPGPKVTEMAGALGAAFFQYSAGIGR
jgi:quinol monooxygenase YgiN